MVPLPLDVFVGGEILRPAFDEGDDILYRRDKFPAVSFLRVSPIWGCMMTLGKERSG